MSVRRTESSRGSRSALELTSASVNETQAFGKRVGCALRAGDVVALYGELGSGKTTLIQGIAQGTGTDPSMVKSPTFVLQREYPGPVPLIHLDGYRLEGIEEAASLDPDLLFSRHKITVIEWAERFEGLLPEGCLQVRLSHVSTNRRRIAVSATGPRATEIVARLQDPTPHRGDTDAGAGD